jgi:hypothetical protein
MEILQRLVWSLQNSIELFSRHPLLAWNLLCHRECHGQFREIVLGSSVVSINTTDDGWKEVGELLKDKICHRFTK